MRLTRKQFVLVLLSVAGVLATAIYSRTTYQLNRNPGQRVPSASQQPAADAAYVESSVCSSCHQDIARTYSLTGMGRSFSRLLPDSARAADGAGGRVADFTTRNRLYHKASDRHYTMVERGGRIYQRRHQIGFEGREANALELEAHYVIGSGNHAQTFLHRAADGRLLQMPVSWYTESGGYWAMSPGYDKPAHLDFRRAIDVGCMSCHNGYPLRPVEDDGTGPRFDPSSLPDGIDCQRCHGPGRAHVDAIKSGDLEAARRTIVNPAKLGRERQLEACMQCHLESTSSPLPFQIPRYGQPPFSYVPGKALGDYFIHFDHAAGTPDRDDKFEIAGGAYRLRKSACFQRSEMTCLTCHNPHDVPRGSKAVERYVAICGDCHQAPHRAGVPQVPGVSSNATCLDCHMPKRRTEDAVHVVMTDHYIQRQRPRRDLLAGRAEADTLKHGYRGDVALYYPATLPSTPENDLYKALAQVQQGSNLKAGIPLFQEAIERHRPERPEFYYELARAYSTTADHDGSIRWYREALRRDANFVPALKELAAASMAKGDLAEAGRSLEKAVTVNARDGNAFADLGNVYLRQDRSEDALKTLRRAVALDPMMPRAHNTLGLAAVRLGDSGTAETHLREAIRLQPDLAEAHNNLGNLLAGRRAYGEAAHHFQKAIASDPTYVEARHSYGVTLALTHSYPRAAAELEAVIRLAPQLAQARVDLADVLATLGRVAEAEREYRIAAGGNDQAAREAALAGLRALGR